MLPSGESNSSRRFLGRRIFALVVAGALVTLAAVFIFRSVQQPDSQPPPRRQQPGGLPPVARNKPVAPPKPAAKAADGWDSEEFGAAVQKQLSRIGKILASTETPAEEHLAGLAAETFTSGSLRPKNLSRAFRDGSLTVLRGEARNTTDQPPEKKDNAGAFHGAMGMRDALGELRQPFSDQSAVRVKFKVVRVELLPESATTVVYFHAAGRGQQGGVQQNATWRCRWARTSSDRPPLLERIEVVDYEEIASDRKSAMFADCTEAVLGRNSAFRKQLLHGVDYWRKRMQADFEVGLHGHQGIAVGDANGDGLDDLYVCQPGGLPNRLFLKDKNGTARDVSAASGVDWLDTSRSALFVDLDNDGDQDLVIAMNVNLMILSNDGTGKFTERKTVYTAGNPYSLSAADYDNDGDLDLFATGYGAGFLTFDRQKSVVAAAIPYPYHDANNGAPNMLLNNEGNWLFKDVTRECGLDVNNRRWSLAAAWEDYDNDGDLDLYVANDYGRNNLYRNDNGKFVDIADKAGVEDIAAGMSVSWADFDGDGLMDLYVGNMFSSAGGRIAYQRRFQPSASEDVRRQFQRHARGNTLFKNAGNGTFHDVSESANVTMGRWAWGSRFVDLNNDGREDLFVANGYITGPDTDDL